ncbi:YkyA family protein [Heyndrickxia sporothermodurans]
MANYKILLMIIFVLVMLSGCQATSEEKIYHILEQTVAKEKDFDKQQKPLMELETQEKRLFEKIIDLGMKDMDKIVKLSNEAIGNLEKRREKMKIERASILSSKKEFSKIKGHMRKIASKKIKKEVIQLQQLMEKRYETHEKLFKAYLHGIDTNMKLYQILKDKKLQIGDLEKQIQLSNEAYSEVLKMNQLFNENTKKFNEQKSKFYKDAQIKIS